MAIQTTRTGRVLVALAMLSQWPQSAHSATTNWTDNSGGSFTDSRNWDNGVPGSDDLAVFRRGNVAYTVTFVDPFPPPIGSAIHPEINRLVIGTNTVTFFSLLPSTLTMDDFALLGGDTIIGQTASDVAVLNMNLASLSTLYATLGLAAGANGTLNINTARTFNVTGTGAANDLIVGVSGTGSINLSGNADMTVADDTVLGRDATGVGNVSISGVGTTWTSTGDLTVGGSGTGTLIVDAGAEFINAIGYVGNNAGSTGTATINGTNTVWRNTAGLYVGYSGNGTLNLTSGGDLISATTSYIGYNSGSVGVANVSNNGGTLSRFVQNGELFVGHSGTGSLNITAGGYAQNTNAYIGQNASGDGSVTVSGANSEWNNFTGSLTVGNAGNGTLNVTAGGEVKNTTGTMADDAGSIGEVVVDGLSSAWTNSGNLRVGNLGQGTLTIQNSGLVSVAGITSINNLSTVNLAGGTLRTGSISTFDRINWSAGTLNLTAMDVRIENASMFHNSLTIGPNKTLVANKSDGRHTVSDIGGAMLTVNGGKAAFTGGTLNVGDQTGANGSLEIIGSGQFECRELYVARESGSSGSVRIRGPQSAWIGALGASSTFDVGFAGDGVFDILDGGRVQFAQSGRSYVGRKDGATGLLRVDGTGSTLSMSLSLTPLAIGGDISQTVGGGGTGRMEVTAGGRVETTLAHIGYGNASTGTVLVTGPGSTWNNALLLSLGNATFPLATTYSHASLTITSGGTVNADGISVAGMGGEAIVVVDGNGSLLNIANDLGVAGNAPGNIGGGYGVLRIINGGDVSSGAANTSGKVQIDGIGSLWEISGDLAVTGNGDYGDRVEVTHGSRLKSGTASIGQLGAVTPSAVLVDGAGSVWENATELRLGHANQYRGMLEIANGGRVEVGSASLGYSPEAVGAAMVSGANSLWEIQGELHLGGGVANQGFMYIAGGGEVRSEEAFIGTKSLMQDLNSAAEVDGADSAWINELDIHIGYNNTVGRLAVTNGALVQSADVFVEGLGEIRGNGTIVADIQSRGLVSPGTSPGALHVDGQYSQTATGKLMIELASASSFDQLLVTGEASLGGTLSVALMDSFTPSAGNLFEVLHADGGIFNEFATATLPALGTNLQWNVIYSNFAVLLEVVSTLAGDYDGDGKVDAADYVVWRKNDGTQQGYDNWRANFGRTAGGGSGATGSSSDQLSVPEPSGLLLCCIACVAIAGARAEPRTKSRFRLDEQSGRNQPPWRS